MVAGQRRSAQRRLTRTLGPQREHTQPVRGQQRSGGAAAGAEAALQEEMAMAATAMRVTKRMSRCSTCRPAGRSRH